MNFNFICPTNIVFGVGEFNNIYNYINTFGTKCLVVTGKTSMNKFGYLDVLKKNLEKKNIDISIFDNISNDAKSNEVNSAINICKKKKIEFIIGLGGGSALDAAKAVAVGFDLENIEEMIGKNLNPNKKSLPIIAIPTTAGTGSEVTRGSIITDVKRKFKSGIRGYQVFPKVAIIDPALSLTMPKEVMINTGFDAFTHLFESFIAKKSNKITDKISTTGINLILEYLVKGIKNPNDIEFRKNISFAALLGGVNVGNASTCLPHRLQQAMGSVKEIKQPHARGLASLYPAWLEEVYPFIENKIINLKKICGIKSNKLEFINQFMEDINIKNKLSEHNIKKIHFSTFIKNISGNVENDQIKNIDNDLILKIYEKSF